MSLQVSLKLSHGVETADLGNANGNIDTQKFSPFSCWQAVCYHSSPQAWQPVQEGLYTWPEQNQQNCIRDLVVVWKVLFCTAACFCLQGLCWLEQPAFCRNCPQWEIWLTEKAVPSRRAGSRNRYHFSDCQSLFPHLQNGLSKNDSMLLWSPN